MVPDYFEAITAYRVWNVFPNGLMVGQAHAEPWPPYEPFVGRCGYASSPDHVKDGRFLPAPVYSCDCGVHALKDSASAPQRILDEEESNRSGFFTMRFSMNGYAPPEGRVWGLVKLWGRLIEHEIGYRAEFAYPSTLFCEDEKLAAVVSALYGVPCEVQKLTRPEWKTVDVEDFLSRYGTVSGIYTAPIYYSPFTISAYPYPTQPPAPVPPTSLAQVKAIGASPYQRKAETQRAANKAAAEAKKRDLIQKYIGKKSEQVQC